MTQSGQNLHGAHGAASAPRCALVCPASQNLTISAPVNLGYLAANLALHGWDVRLFDFKLPGVSYAQLMESLAAWNPRLVGVSCMTVEMPFVQSLVPDLKRRLPHASVVLGGVHPTALPGETLEDTGADVVVRGEGDTILPALARTLETPGGDLRQVPGVSFLENRALVSTPDQPPALDLDSLPFPAWHLMPPALYSRFPWQLYKRRPVVAPVLTSRGCPFHCTYCASSLVHGTRLRLRSPENVASEMQMLMRDFSVGEFQIIDDNMTMSKQHALALCREITDRKLGAVWKMPNGIVTDTVDHELARAMKQAGCYELGLAIESASPEILKRARKKVDLEHVRGRIKILKQHGIRVYGFFMLGMPGETPDTIRQTIRFMRQGFDYMSVSFCVPYPGSALYDTYFKNKGARPDWGRLIHFQPFPEMCSLSEKQLRSFMRRALLGFYLHPRRLALMLRKVLSVHPRYTLRLALKYFGGGGS